MAGQQLRASIIVDLVGNIANRARQYGGAVEQMARRSQSALRGLRSSVVSVSAGIDKMGAAASRSFGIISRGAIGVAAAGYTANKLFINPASQRENYRIALNSQYNGDKAKAKEAMDWAIKNAKDTTWGLTGVMQEMVSSKGFGMDDKQTRAFIGMLQDQGAYRGWDLTAAQGASLQLKQMYSRQQITAQDANLLTGYGVNVYQILADKLGKSVKDVRAAGEKGLLGPKSIQLLFQAMTEQAKGAQANAMNTWTGLTAQLGDVWDDFANKVMDKGPFDLLKKQVKGVLTQYDAMGKPGKGGKSELDVLTDKVATELVGAFDLAKGAATGLWDAVKGIASGLKWINENVVSLEKVGKALVGIYAANKLLRLGGRAIGGTYRMVSAPVRGYRWLRNRRKGKPGVGDAMPSVTGAFGVQQVFVTNWPMGGLGGGFGADVGTGKSRKGRRKKGPGRNLPRNVSVAAAPAVAKRGFFGRMFSGAASLAGSAASWVGNSSLGKGLASIGQKSSSMIGSAGKWIANSGFGQAAGKIAAQGSKALGWLGRVGSKLGGPVLSALTLAPTLLDDEVSTRDKGSAIGATAGAWALGAVGSLAGPIGTAAGATLGGYLGDYLGGWMADLYTQWEGGPKDSGTTQPPPEQKVQADASLRISLADGLQLTSTKITEDGMGLNVYDGNNYYPF
ncbi:tape measure protein [Serratia marcescens]|uniref:tape measure protein n=1 Tax=Serratia marcescens TaxID=615 RepID=UPI0027E57695|nr:tape measure protein [Serratia marcescens]MCX2172100.1 tape measure protein [Serratia marcescens]MCX2178028.1 tape measure protein [Serratia marcescens]